MHIHIDTQYKENYGTAEAPYWKFKGGSTVVVTGFDHPLTNGIGAAAQAVVDALRPSIEYSNEYAEVYILDWAIVSKDALPQDELMQLEYDGRISFPCKRLAVPAAKISENTSCP
jgi:hypothetical protein